MQGGFGGFTSSGMGGGMGPAPAMGPAGGQMGGMPMNYAMLIPLIRRWLMSTNFQMPSGPQSQPGGPLTGYLPQAGGGMWGGDYPQFTSNMQRVAYGMLSPQNQQRFATASAGPASDTSGLRYLGGPGSEWDPYARKLAGQAGDYLPTAPPAWMSLWNNQAETAGRGLQRQAELGARLNPNLDPSQRAYLGMQAGINTYGAQANQRNQALLDWYKGNEDYMRQAQRDAAMTAWGRTGQDEAAAWQQKLIEAQKPTWQETLAGIGGQALGGWAGGGFQMPRRSLSQSNVRG
jgi:hypothetical protein